MQRERRRDPYPWTWEIPTLITAAVLLAALIAVQLGRSLANVLAGAGWTWPAADHGQFGTSPLGAAFWSSLPGVITGHAAAGLPHPVPNQLAGAGLLWGTLAVSELVVLSATTWVIVKIWTRWGPGRMAGMASSAEAERLLGVSRLRKVAPIVRPDIYGKATVRIDDINLPRRTPPGRIEKPASPWAMKGRTR